VTIITPTPFTFRDATVQIGTDNYEAAISKAEIVPTTATVVFKGVAPGASFTDVTEASWVANIEYAQDWSNPDSLANYLHEHAGETVDMTFVPKRGTGQPSVTAEVILVPGSIGGTVDQTAKGSVSLGVNGKPAIVPAV
jgi:hypothetical protein